MVWRPAFFGIKPELVIKGGFIAWGAMGDSAASLMTCEPVMLRPQWGAFGRAAPALSACFVHPAGHRHAISGEAWPEQKPAPGQGHTQPQEVRHAAQRGLPGHPRRPADLRRFRRRRAGHLRPAKEVPLARRYMLR